MLLSIILFLFHTDVVVKATKYMKDSKDVHLYVNVNDDVQMAALRRLTGKRDADKGNTSVDNGFRVRILVTL